MDSLTELVPALGRSNVKMKNPEFVEKAIRVMMKDAHHKLQVVADFDRTLSKYSENGKICCTTHNVLEQSQYMPDYFKEEALKLKDIYLPIEFDHTKTVEEKIPKMIEWWTKGHELVTSCHLTRDTIRHIVADSFARLRNGCKWFFDQLHELDIPILIFSAGIGDIIHETIIQQATFHRNMKIVSNFLKFDEQGKVIGFDGDDIIHTFNKNENTIHSGDYFYNIRHRENLLLLGDSIGDLGMSEGADHVECELKIGFLNFKESVGGHDSPFHSITRVVDQLSVPVSTMPCVQAIQVEDNLPTYLESFDVVIIEDESLDVVNGIMKTILGISI